MSEQTPTEKVIEAVNVSELLKGVQCRQRGTVKEIVAAVAGFLLSAALPAAHATLYAYRGDQLYFSFNGSTFPGGAIAEGLFAGFLLFYIPALAIALLLGAPIFLMWRRHNLFVWWTALMSGGVIDAVIAGWSINRPLNVTYLAQHGVVGAIGGFVFWLIWRLGR